MKHIKDTISGNPGLWIPIIFKNQLAYVWDNILVDAYIDNLNNANDKILLKVINSKLNFKVFRHNSLIYQKSISEDTEFNNGFYLMAIGKTYLSNNDVFALYNYWDKGYKLYEWTGSEIIKSDIKLIDDSKITNKYFDFPFSIVNNDQAALRTEPDTNAKVNFCLPLNTRIKVVEPNINMQGGWHKVEWNNKPYYVDYKDLCLTTRYIKSNKHKGISFLYANNAVFAFKNDSIIDKLQIPFRAYREELYEISSLGIDLGVDLLGVKVNNYASGADFGEDIYSWDGKHLKFLCSDIKWDDIGDHTGANYDFPYETGLEGKILFRDYYIEYFNNPVPKQQTNCSDFEIKIRERVKQIAYQGDSLIEIPSKYSSLEIYIKKQFPDYEFQHASYFDINKDGLDDAIFFIDKTYANGSSIEDFKVIIAFGDKKGGFQTAFINNYLVKGDNRGVKFEYDNDTLSIFVTEFFKTKYGDGFNDQPKDYYKHREYVSKEGLKVDIYKFGFNSKLNNLFLLSQNEYKGIKLDYFEYNWKPQKIQPRSTGVTFEKCGLAE
ncbi:MAG: hypothetical protein K9J13_08560 [Saprospiraceae bacterium]|nr:hypothetical protein [Saprospiraceae bacterium]